MEYRELRGSAPSLLGYGCMRFPIDRRDGTIDEQAATALIRRAMEGGVTYYDTAVPYHDGQSEAFMGRALAHYDRGSYLLATKLPCWEIDSAQQALEVFHQSLEHLRTDYVDYYLLHSLSKKTWDRMVDLGVVQALEGLQREGKIRRLGFSFHDALPVFQEILDHRAWDFCQIQLNYMDTQHQAGLAGLELARARGIPVVVMEPVKGGSLAQLPQTVTAPLTALDPQASAARWAMRWVASQPGVQVILSGMTDMAQLEDNLAAFSPLRPLDEGEERAIGEVADALRRRIRNGCTACRYCMPCPAGVDIPQNFAIWNEMGMYENRTVTRRKWKAMGADARAALCHGCGRCETLCPQHLSIRRDLGLVTQEVLPFAGLE